MRKPLKLGGLAPLRALLIGKRCWRVAARGSALGKVLEQESINLWVRRLDVVRRTGWGIPAVPRKRRCKQAITIYLSSRKERGKLVESTKSNPCTSLR